MLRMTGGTSGNREDALPNVPSSGVSQPVLDTSSGTVTSKLNLCQNTANGPSPGAPGLAEPQVPSNGSIPMDSTDVADQDVIGLGPGSGDSSVFKGATNDFVSPRPS